MAARKLSHPHDRLIKRSFGQPHTASNFFQTYLPAELAASRDWSTLNVVPGSFIDPKLRRRESDLLFRVGSAADSTFMYCLFEDQSTSDPWMGLRLMGYMENIWQELLRAKPRPKLLPTIIPVVLYHGASGWKAPRRWSEKLAIPAGLEDVVRKYQPDFEYVLVDLSAIKAEDIRGDLIVRAVLGLMKAAAERRILQWLDTEFRLIRELWRQPSVTGMVEAMLHYIFAVDSRINRKRLVRLLEEHNAPDIKDKAMSIADQLRREGRREGRQEGRQEGALIGSIRTMQDLLGLPVSDFKTLAAKSQQELQALATELRATAQR